MQKIISKFLKFMHCSNGDEGIIYLVETVPINLDFVDIKYIPNTGKTIARLIKDSKKSIEISSIYTTYINHETPIPVPGDEIGKEIYDEIIKAAQRGVNIRFIVTTADSRFPQLEIKELCAKYPGRIQAGYLDMPTISPYKEGIHHTKFHLFDDSSFYLGSSNSDWRSYSEIAELGIVGENVKNATLDLKKIFDMYWAIAFNKEKVPVVWPKEYDTIYDNKNPLWIEGSLAYIYFTSSPSCFVSNGRLSDDDAILNVIESQKGGTLRVCAMQYSFFSYYLKDTIFWGKIDYALRTASVERNVQINVLVEESKFKEKKMAHSLVSLNGYGKINIKLIKFPQSEVVIPFGRLFHSKSMIGDESAWIGTSNLVPDYFLTTTGIGFVVYNTRLGGEMLIDQAKSIFDRYYYSKYATELNYHR